MFVGSDTDELRAAAGAFEQLAKDVETWRLSAGERAQALDWVGTDADQFRIRVSDDFAAEFIFLGFMIEDAAWVLRDNAEEQDIVSDTLQGGRGAMQHITRQFERTSRASARASAVENYKRSQFENWWEREGHLRADQLQTASPEDQAAWWASLTPDQQRYMMMLYPGFLVGMAGLSSDVKQQAIDQIREDQAANLVESSDATEIELDLHIPFHGASIDLGVSGKATVSEMGDGTYVVDLELSGQIGASVRAKSASSETSAGGGVEGTVSQSYRFNSKAEAEAFLEGLYAEVVPSGVVEIGRGLIPFGGAANVVADAAKDGLVYLDSYSDNLENTSLEAKLYGEGSVKMAGGGAEAKLSGSAGIGVKHDMDSDGSSTTTYFVETKLSASAEAGGISGSRSLDASVSLVTEGGEATALKISGSFSGSSGADLYKMLGVEVPGTAEISNGMTGSVDIRIDLQDPYVAQQAQQLVTRAMNGDSGALDSLQSLYRHAEISVSLDNVTTAENGVDLVVIEAKRTQTHTENLASYIKPVGSAAMVEL